ncbi:MAG: 30S ribosomal protein S6 [Candidatus Staskawiczbacteria bacterium]|nr:30S ribosomal protein S6 [Candidatus Staskawiczbacteria bacterium]
MKIYELTYIIPSDIDAAESEAVIQKIEPFIQENEGSILKREGPISKVLAYPIESKGSGFFYILEFQMDPEKISALKEKIEKEPKIIRHMLLSKKPGRKIKENKRKSKFAVGLETQKSIVLGEDEFSFVSPFASKSENTPAEEKKEDIPAEKKPDGEKQEKVELKDIEKKLDELLNE